MQIDFHHAVTYVVARLAGFNHERAEIISYCAQYVDDATNSGTIMFDNGAMFTRTSSAHRMLDYRNFQQLANHHVWIPFHFLPGNGGKKPGEDPSGSFIQKIVCRPNSHVAKEMVRACILNQEKEYALHRLGITLHVLADTWAHQGFAGVIHEINDIRTMTEQGEIDQTFIDKLKEFFGSAFDAVACRFMGDILPLGHGAALSFPDLPFLKWEFKDHLGNTVKRNNTRNFMEAAEEMCKVLQRYLANNPDADVPGLPDDDRDKIWGLMAGIRSPEGEARHKEWLRHIKEGFFSFPRVNLSYKDKGKGSWKQKALDTTKRTDSENDIFPYSPSFLDSNWKRFHDALLAHRFTLVHEILPQYGICTA